MLRGTEFSTKLSLKILFFFSFWVIPEKLTGPQLVKKIPAFHGTRRYITAPVPILSQINLLYALHPTSWKSILILSSHLCLGLPIGLFPSGFLTKTLYTPLLSPIRATCPAHLIRLDFTTRTILGEEYRSLSSSLCSFLHSPVTSKAQTFSSAPYSQTPSACIPPSMSATKFQPIQNNRQNHSSPHQAGEPNFSWP